MSQNFSGRPSNQNARHPVRLRSPLSVGVYICAEIHGDFSGDSGDYGQLLLPDIAGISRKSGGPSFEKYVSLSDSGVQIWPLNFKTISIKFSNISLSGMGIGSFWYPTLHEFQAGRGAKL